MKTELEVIRGQIAEKMTRAIVETIEDGAEIKHFGMSIAIDGVIISKATKGGKPVMILELDAPEIDELFEPGKEELQDRINKLNVELAELNNKLKFVTR